MSYKEDTGFSAPACCLTSHVMTALKPQFLLRTLLLAVQWTPLTKLITKARKTDVCNILLNKGSLIVQSCMLEEMPRGFDTRSVQNEFSTFIEQTKDRPEDADVISLLRDQESCFSTIEKRFQTTKTKAKVCPHFLQKAWEGNRWTGSCSWWGQGTDGGQICLYQMLLHVF